MRFTELPAGTGDAFSAVHAERYVESSIFKKRNESRRLLGTGRHKGKPFHGIPRDEVCLLYTSDAADEL